MILTAVSNETTNYDNLLAFLRSNPASWSASTAKSDSKPCKISINRLNAFNTTEKKERPADYQATLPDVLETKTKKTRGLSQIDTYVTQKPKLNKLLSPMSRDDNMFAEPSLLEKKLMTKHNSSLPTSQ